MHNDKLPVGVYWKHGAYYRALKQKWIRLGVTMEEMMAALPDAKQRLPSIRAEVLAMTMKKFASTRQNAKTRGIPFELTRDDVPTMLNAGKWRCAVTGTPFTAEIINGQRPYSPSIDRRDSTLGYTPRNCRVVCVAANFAMNVWGESVLRGMRRNMARPDFSLDVSNSPVDAG